MIFRSVGLALLAIGAAMGGLWEHCESLEAPRPLWVPVASPSADVLDSGELPAPELLPSSDDSSDAATPSPR